MTSPPLLWRDIVLIVLQLFALVLRNADKSTVRPFNHLDQPLTPAVLDIFGKGLNLPAPLDIQWPKCFQLQGLTPDQGLCPWTPLGALPPDPRYRLVFRTRHGAPNHWPLPLPMPMSKTYRWICDQLLQQMTFSDDVLIIQAYKELHFRWFRCVKHKDVNNWNKHYTDDAW